MNNLILTEDAIHYVAWFLDSFSEKVQTAHHKRVLVEYRTMSNKLIETLEVPTRITVHRHLIERGK